VEAKAGDTTVWLVELQQAGAFGVRNFPQPDLQRLLGIFCPNYLLPYAREVISSLLTRGGFPPFLLPPVNFEGLFNQAAQRAQQPQQPASPAASVN
jgi:preprotein translocase subunit SecB